MTLRRKLINLCHATDSMHCLCGCPKLLQDSLPCARLYTDAMLSKIFSLERKEAYPLHAPSSAACWLLCTCNNPRPSCMQRQALSVGVKATHVLLLSPVLPPMQDKKKYERARELLYLEDQFNIAKRVVSDEQCHACCTQMSCASVHCRQRCQVWWKLSSCGLQHDHMNVCVGMQIIHVISATWHNAFAG